MIALNMLEIETSYPNENILNKFKSVAVSVQNTHLENIMKSKFRCHMRNHAMF